MTVLDTTNHLIRRDRAVRQIANHLADQDVYLITVPHGALESAVDTLDPITPWQAYVDNGSGLVLRSGMREPVALAAQLYTTVAVLVVPKSVDPEVLSSALRQPLPPDGSQDLLILRSRTGPIHWPLLFVDAVDQVDPIAAAQLRAHGIPAAT